MLLLAHTGITLGLALSANKALHWHLPFHISDRYFKLVRPLKLITNCIDYRLVLIGSMLPDIIDKPLGHWIIPSLENGRIFCHTLLFLLILLSISIWQYRKAGRTGFLALTFGSAVHLALDQMWYEPETVLWPMTGLSFHKQDQVDLAEYVKEALLHDSATYIPEAIGFLLLTIIGFSLLRQRRLFDFLQTGAI